MSDKPTTPDKPLRVFSFGGGVQSHAVLVLQAQGKLETPYDVFVFANVGDDSENPKTLEYIEQYTKPFCEQHGINFVEVQKTLQNGEKDTVLKALYRQQKSILIPVRMANGAPGNRGCTYHHKIAIVDKFIRSTGASHAVVGLGISLDEWKRVKDEDWHEAKGFQRRRDHPLMDLRLDRNDCYQIITEAGLPTPPKSSCWFCPFGKLGKWTRMRFHEPEQFEQVAVIEDDCNVKRQSLGKDPVFIHPSCIPIRDAVGVQPYLPMFEPENEQICDGYCHT